MNSKLSLAATLMGGLLLAAPGLMASSLTDTNDPYVLSHEIQAVPSPERAMLSRAADHYDPFLTPSEVMVTKGCYDTTVAHFSDTENPYIFAADLQRLSSSRPC